MYQAKQLSPMVPSRDIAKTREFFVETLKFSPVMDSPEYCLVSRDGFELHIQRAGEGVGQMSFYLTVDDIEAVWDLIRNQKEEFQAREPFDQPYGMREIHLAVPQTEALMFIGQPVERGDGGK